MSEHAPDPIVNGILLTKGTELMVRGKQGKFRYVDASHTAAGRTVLNLIGPVGAHEHWGACYVESVKKVFPNKTK